MPDLVLVLALLLAAGCAWWLLGDLRTVPTDAGAPAGAADGTGAAAPAAGSVTVVVPARDEEATLPTLLGSLRALSTPVLEVVVVDDGSTDATAHVARDGGARVVAASTPPPGWTGKAWACHLGAEAGRGDLLLFLDADTELAPDAVDGLLALRARDGGLVSVQPFHRVVRPYEQLSMYFNVMSLMASGAFTPRTGRRPMAFGPCLLTSRADYERAGGHAAVRGAILDDVELALAFDRAGLPVRCAVGGPAVRMRSYPSGLRQLADGWTKNVASGASAARRAPALGALLWMCAHHATGVGLVLALIEVALGRELPGTYGALEVWAVAWVGFAWQLRAILRRVGSFAWWTWALFPAALVAFDLLFARSAVLTVVRRSVSWRGRPVDLDRRSSARGA